MAGGKGNQSRDGMRFRDTLSRSVRAFCRHRETCALSVGESYYNVGMRQGTQTPNRENESRTQNTYDLCVAKPVATDRYADPKKNTRFGTIELEEAVESPFLCRQEQALSTEKNSQFLCI